MHQEPDISKLTMLLTLRQQGLSHAEISERIGATQEAIKQFIAFAESSAVEAPPMTDREAIAELADGVQRGDDIAVFSILEERRKNVRWVNPLRLGGAQELEALKADMESAKGTDDGRVFIVLPTDHAPSWLTPELLSSFILQAKSSFVLVSSRAVLQKMLCEFG